MKNKLFDQIVSILSKTVFYGSLLVLVLCVAIPIFIDNTNYEFVDGGRFFDIFVLFAIPISILFTITGMFAKREINSVGFAVFRVVGTIILAVVVFFYMFMNTALDLCSESNIVLFELKANKSIQIVERSFGCGAVDSTPSTISIVKAEKKMFGLMYVSKVDTTQIDKELWLRKNIKP